jgi:hypothetical protein
VIDRPMRRWLSRRGLQAQGGGRSILTRADRHPTVKFGAGTPQAVVVEAQNATVQEILIALSDAFEVQFRSAANLDKRLTGTYKGTLQQAMSRVLKGYDFVVKSGRSGLEITLLGAGKPVAVVEARSVKKSAELTSTATNAAPDVPQPRSDGPTPRSK